MTQTITSVEFVKYKAFRNFSLSLQKRNILVGPNNCGKSTIIGAFRVLAEGIRKARAKSPEFVFIEGSRQRCYRIPSESIAISTENVHTNYEEVDSSVTFRISNGNRLRLLFPSDGGCLLLPETERSMVSSPSSFKSAFPITVAVVPVLGPLEHDEEPVKRETVQRNLHTTRASRHFRNYWRFYPEGFSRFSNLIENTWPGMSVTAPVDDGDAIHMFCEESRYPRELFWSGFGFQVWCQMLTHLDRGKNDTMIVVDEPEIYLHPDLQRQVLDILFSLGPHVVMATHSAEMIGAADPRDLVMIDKRARSARRLGSDEAVQQALDSIGSLHNVTLTRIAKHRRVLFVEGKDYPLLLKFSKAAGLSKLAEGTDLPAVSSDGFSNWTRVRDAAWGIRKILGGPFEMCCVLDRDFRSQEEIDRIEAQLKTELRVALFLKRKEIENYLLIPSLISRCVNSQRNDKSSQCTTQEVRKALMELTENSKSSLQAQYSARRHEYLRKAGDRRDAATVLQQTAEWFEVQWETFDGRMAIVGGKETLSKVREWSQQKYDVTLTTSQLLSKLSAKEIPPDLSPILIALDEFRSVKPEVVDGDE